MTDTPHTPLLAPADREAGDGSTGPDEGLNYVDIQHTKGFSRSPQRNSFTMDSVGRRSIIDTSFAFGTSPSNSAAPGSAIDSDYDDEEGEVEEEANHQHNQDYNDQYHRINRHSYEALTPAEATRLAREQQTLLNDNNIDYGNYGALGSDPVYDARNEVVGTNKVWDEAVDQGKVQTSIKRELIVLCNSSLPLTVTFLLQFSLPVASVFSVGHLGKTELGAVSLASMTANITGFAMIQGFATCLDTLCSQAYGAGKLNLVGLYFQKCVVLIMSCFVPVAVIWYFSEPLLNMIVPDPDIAALATVYLRIVMFAAPGYILFECGKKYVQAQGIFHASTMILLVCAPFNMIMNYILVWNENIGVGFAGAPLAVLMTNWLMPLLLFLYVYFVDGSQCWAGLSPDIFRNWKPMFKLAIPGFIMIEAEFFAFEIMTLAASRISTAALAAQSVLTTVTSLTYQIPFAISIALATRVANFVGATLKEPAKLTGWIGIVSAYLIAIFNGLVLYFLRYEIGGLFSNDEDVIELIAAAMPICSLLQLVDSPGCITGGILRGQGRQHLAGYLNLFFYYLVALPLAMVLAFGYDMKLYGLWAGLSAGLAGVTIGETYFILKSDWDKIVQEASERDRDERIVGHV